MAEQDIVFEVMATFPITCQNDQNLDFNLDSFIAALEAAKEG